MTELNYPPLPEKDFFTIGEAADLVLSKPHVLRHWEKKAGFLFKNIRRQGKRRYYSRDDILLLRRMNTMRQEGHYTIAGSCEMLSSEKKNQKKSEKQGINLRKEIEKIIDIL